MDYITELLLNLMALALATLMVQERARAVWDCISLMWYVKRRLVFNRAFISQLQILGSFILFWLFIMVRTVVHGFRLFEPEPEVQTIYVRVRDSIPIDYLSLVDFRSLLVILVGTVLTAVIGWASLLVLSRLFMRLSLRCRGIKTGLMFESMVEGSEFCPSSLPSCQVPLYALGYFMNSFLGFGVRVGSFLVVPTHVIHSAGLSKIVMSRFGGKGGVVLESAPIISKVVMDVSYYPLTDEVWANLQIQTAKLSLATEGLVTVVGFKESTPVASSGQIAKSQFVGVVKYSGSTLSGFSGAPYMINSLVLGIHTGAASDHNMGISASVLRKEIQSFMVTEKKRGKKRGVRIDDEDYLPAEARVPLDEIMEHTVWSMDDIDRRVRGARSGDWFDQAELEEAGISWESSQPGPSGVLSKAATDALMGLPASVVEEIQRSTGLRTYPVSRLTVTGQSNDTSQVQVAVDACGSRFASLNKRVHVLEGKVGDIRAFLEKRPHGPPLPPSAPKAKPEVLVKTVKAAKPEIAPKKTEQPKGQEIFPKKALTPAQRARKLKSYRRRLVKKALSVSLGQSVSATMSNVLQQRGLLKPRNAWPPWAQGIASQLLDAANAST